MADTETIYAIDNRVRKLPLDNFEMQEYEIAWSKLLNAKSDFFGDHSRLKLRALNNAYSHWHTITEDVEIRYIGWGAIK